MASLLQSVQSATCNLPETTFSASEASAFLDLTSHVPPGSLTALDVYLKAEGICNFEAAHADGRVGVFSALGQKHAAAIELCDRDTSVWVNDSFVPLSSVDDFKQCRAHRADGRTWKPNMNAYVSSIESDESAQWLVARGLWTVLKVLVATSATSEDTKLVKEPI